MPVANNPSIRLEKEEVRELQQILPTPYTNLVVVFQTFIYRYAIVHSSRLFSKIHVQEGILLLIDTPQRGQHYL